MDKIKAKHYTNEKNKNRGMINYEKKSIGKRIRQSRYRRIL